MRSSFLCNVPDDSRDNLVRCPAVSPGFDPPSRTHGRSGRSLRAHRRGYSMGCPQGDSPSSLPDCTASCMPVSDVDQAPRLAAVQLTRRSEPRVRHVSATRKRNQGAGCQVKTWRTPAGTSTPGADLVHAPARPSSRQLNSKWHIAMPRSTSWMRRCSYRALTGLRKK
jgi:hypothetical protein